MASSTGWRRRVIGLAAAGVGCALLAATMVAAPAGASTEGETGQPPGSVTRSDGVLSGRLLALSDPAVATAPARVQAESLSLARHGTGSLVRSGGAVLVQVSLADIGSVTRADLARVGEIVNVSPEMSRATLLVAPDRLGALAALPAVEYADVVPAPISSSAGSMDTAVRATVAGTRRARCHPITSEADTQLRAAKARKLAGVDGSGVTVGVLSDSYDVDPAAATFAFDDVRSGDLPGFGNPCGRSAPVRVVAEFQPDGTTPMDEGRAMLQGIHDVAPGARLAFATASGGPDAFAANIKALARAGAGVIVDDITYLTEPFFQAGVIEKAVSSVVGKGVTYLSSAGNSNVVLGGRNVSSWETPAVRLADCPELDVDPSYGNLGQCVNFDPTGTDVGYDITVGPGGSITPVLQWAEPIAGVTDDFDLFVASTTNGDVLAHSTAVQSRSKTPVEYLTWTNDTATAAHVRLVVNRFSGTGNPRLKLAFATSSGLQSVQYDTSQAPDVVGPTVFGHNGGADTISVAAVPFNDASVVEPYSARGPVTRYYGPVKNLARPARTLASPQVINAPQVAATDGTANTFFGTPNGGVYRFFGTSAAAPAAAGVAALMKAVMPTLRAAQVRSALERTAAKVGTAPADAVGKGLVDARRAVALVAPAGAPVVTRTKAKPKAVKVSFSAAEPGPAPITGYVATCLRPGRSSGHSASRSGTSTADLVVGGLKRGKAYACSVRARTEFGLGVASAPGPTAVARGVPSRPRHVRVEAAPRAVRVSFRPAENQGGRKLTGFTATCTPEGGGKARSHSGRSTTLRVSRLHSRTTYRCVVVATNKLGASRASKRSALVRPLP